MSNQIPSDLMPLLEFRSSLLKRLPKEPSNTLELNEQITLAGIKIANLLQATYDQQKLVRTRDGTQ